MEKAIIIGTQNGNKFWFNDIIKEMTNVRVAFRFKNVDIKPPPAHTPIKLTMAYDVKLDFTCKACLFAWGYLADPPTLMT